MTKQEFNEAVAALRRGDKWATMNIARVAVAAGMVMRHRLGLSDEYAWQGPSHVEFVEFLDAMDNRQRKLLKEIAESLTVDQMAPSSPTLH